MSSLCKKCTKAVFCESEADVSECEDFLDERGYYAEICDECIGNGNDYYWDDDGEMLICVCGDCYVTKRLESLADGKEVGE